MVERLDPVRYRELMGRAQRHATERIGLYEQLAELTVTAPPDSPARDPEPATAPEE